MDERRDRRGLAALGVCGWALIWLAEGLAGDHEHRHVGHATVVAAGGAVVAIAGLLGLFLLARRLHRRNRVADARLTVGFAMSVAALGLLTWFVDYLDVRGEGCFDFGGCPHYTADSLDDVIKAGGIVALVATAVAGVALAVIVSPKPTTEP